jgi:three-Cys-motif partner protein
VPHKADQSFFESKRPWSERKDLILSYYLKPYLPKVATVGRPILLVDGFAGPGEYGDGKAGSPLIMCSRVQGAAGTLKVPVSVLCIEDDDNLFKLLQARISGFRFADARRGKFLDHLPEIAERAKTHSVFLYVDPYAIEGLEWEAMDRVFRHLHDSQMSIEILLNFSARMFARRGLSALQLAAPASDEDADETGTTEPPSISRLNKVVGGDWWQAILKQNTPFPGQVEQISKGFCGALRDQFREVCEHPVRAKWTDTVPKYSLIFGSRSEHALILMNEATIKSRNLLAETARPSEPVLFETRPVELVPDSATLPPLILACAENPLLRRHLVAAVIRRAFCQFTESEIKKAIGELLKRNRLTSETGKAKINDDVRVWRS